MNVFNLPTPDVDSFLQNYKVIAKFLREKEAVPLTQAQHDIARSVGGFKDWQSFHYYFQKLSNIKLNLDKYEWFFLFQSTSELDFDINLSSEILIEKIKFYEHNFISKSSKSISEKIQQMSDIKRKALLATCLLYLKRPYFKIHEPIFKENLDLIEEKNKKKYQEFRVNHIVTVKELKKIFKDLSFSKMPGFSKLNLPSIDLIPNFKPISDLFPKMPTFFEKTTSKFSSFLEESKENQEKIGLNETFKNISGFSSSFPSYKEITIGLPESNFFKHFQETTKPLQSLAMKFEGFNSPLSQIIKELTIPKELTEELFFGKKLSMSKLITQLQESNQRLKDNLKTEENGLKFNVPIPLKTKKTVLNINIENAENLNSQELAYYISLEIEKLIEKYNS